MLAVHAEGNRRILEAVQVSRVVSRRGAPTVDLAQDVPSPGQFDDEIDQWEVAEDRPIARPLRLEVPILLEGATLRAIVTAANAEGLDAQQFIQRAVDSLANALPQP
jgi:hypothetical protein